MPAPCGDEADRKARRSFTRKGAPGWQTLVNALVRGSNDEGEIEFVYAPKPRQLT